MVDHVWSVLCEQVLQNPKNGTMSYINTLDLLPIKHVNKESGGITLEPFFIATKWIKKEEDDVKLYIKVLMLGKSEGDPKYFAEQQVELGTGRSVAALNIDIARLIVQEDSAYNAFEIQYKINKQRKYRTGAILPFGIKKPIVDEESKDKTK